jgi:hypothetical protein
MPQYNAYPSITSLNPADIILVWQDSSSSVKTISYEDLLAEIKLDNSNTLNTTLINTDTTLTGSEQFIVVNSGADVVVTLPLSGSNIGKPLKIARLGSGAVTVERAGSDLIGSATSISLDQYDIATLTADGTTTWFLAK